LLTHFCVAIEILKSKAQKDDQPGDFNDAASLPVDSKTNSDDRPRGSRGATKSGRPRLWKQIQVVLPCSITFKIK